MLLSSRRLSAFTLIEFLITLTLLGVVAAAIFSTFSSGLNIYYRLRRYTDIKTDFFLVYEKMEREIRNAFSFSNIDFIGDRRQISFPALIRSSNDAEAKTFPSKLSYSFNSQTKKFIREAIPYSYLFSDETEHSKYRTEVGAAEDIMFYYYSFNPDSEAYEWTSSWEEGGIPLGVKIETTLKEGGEFITLQKTIFLPVAG